MIMMMMMMIFVDDDYDSFNHLKIIIFICKHLFLYFISDNVQQRRQNEHDL